MAEVTYIGGVQASWNFTRKMVEMCLAEVPPERHEEWFGRVARKMSCTPDEAKSYISGDVEPPEAVSFRLFAAAGYVSQEMFWDNPREP